MAKRYRGLPMADFVNDTTGDRPTVLIVDDDPTNRKAAKRALLNRGWDVIVAGLPGEAVLNLERADVVLLDWQPMGPELSVICHNRGVPFVVWTGAPDAARNCGALVLDKMTLPNEIDRVLRRVVA